MVEWTGFHPSGREDSALDSLILSLSPCSTDHSASFTVHLVSPGSILCVFRIKIWTFSWDLLR
jgi:hypothetical protein